MEALALIEEKRNFKIKKIELKNFIGLQKVSKDNVFKADIEDSEKFIILFGENGMGKTTLLESLTPYSEMISRDIRKSIMFPAYKKIEFVSNKGEKVRLEISWTESSTKGYIYINDEITIETRKGNITEYNFLIDRIFGEYDNFKNSSFLKQGINELIAASPSERVKMINKFMPDISLYDDIKKHSEDEEKVFKVELKNIEMNINDLKLTKAAQENIDNFPIEEVIEKIKKDSESIESNSKLLESKDNSLKEKREEHHLFKSLSKDLMEDEECISSQNKELELKSDLSKIEVEDEGSIKELEKEIKELESQVNINREERTVLKKIKDKSFVFSKDKIKKISTEIEANKQIVEKLKYKERQVIELKKIEKDISAIPPMDKEKIEKAVELNFESLKVEREEVTKIREKWSSEKFHLRDLKEKIKVLSIETIEKLKSNSIKEEVFNLNSNIKEEEARNIEEVILKKEIEKYKDILLGSDAEVKCYCCDSILEREVIEEKIKIREDKVKKSGKVSVVSMRKELNILEELENNKVELSTIDKKEKDLVELEDFGKRKKANIEKLEKEREDLLIKEKEVIKIETLIAQKNKIEENISYLPTSDNLKEVELELKELEKRYLDLKPLLSLNLEEKEVGELLVNFEMKVSKLELLIKEKHESLFKSKSQKEKEKLLKDTLHVISEKIKKHKEAKVNLKSLVEKEIMEAVEILEKEIMEIKELNKQTHIILNENLVKKAEYEKDKKVMEQTLEKYENLLKEKEKIEDEKVLSNTIKNYSSRIKKNYIANFFLDIINNANELIESEEGTLGDIKVRINQKTSRSFNIVAIRDEVETEDISLLSGAEQSVVARSIYWALAKNNHFGILWLDESDGMLSKKNKQSFINTISSAIDSFAVSQVFIISHNEDYLKISDKNILLEEN